MSSVETFRRAPTLSEGLYTALNQAASMLRVTVERSGSAMLLRTGGEVDACNVDTWTRLLSEVADATDAPGPLVVDTTALDFMACCAFAALATRSTQCRNRGIEFCLVSNQPIVTRVMAASRLEAELSFYRNVHAALDAHHHVRQAQPRSRS
jgi:anti-anti-sigma factor